MNKPTNESTRGRLQAAIQTEIDAAFLYEQLAEMADRDDVANVYRQMSQIEKGHAESIRKSHFEAGGEAVAATPSRRARVLAWLARRWGPQIILSSLIELERGLAVAQKTSRQQQGLEATGSEDAHLRILKSIQEQSSRGAEGGLVARLEGRHHQVGGNALRAAVLGANDGLVSNLSLVMGVAGASVDSRGILIAGSAGLLAGAISMALGEWLSVQSSRELYQRHIAIEAAELEASPEQELIELALIYQAKGVSAEQAQILAKQLIENEDTALDTLVREELGIDPEELGGSAWEAAFTSFALFAVGAIIPVIPFLFPGSKMAVLASLGLSSVGLFGIGAAITLLTGRSVLFSGTRQLFFGLAAAAVTFGIGHVLGVALGG